jgi:hypothetical protein
MRKSLRLWGLSVSESCSYRLFGKGLSLLQNGHVERLIGSIRRESLDHLIVFDEAQLRRVLKNYAFYYNEVRTHLSLDNNAPNFRRPQKLGPIAAISMLGGLHH